MRMMLSALLSGLVAWSCATDTDNPGSAAPDTVEVEDIAMADTANDAPDPAEVEADLPATAEVAEDVADEDTAGFACTESAPVPLGDSFFTDISDASQIRVGNTITAPTKKVPINDHSRLGFADIDGDGLDDIVMHSLYPNPQAGIPFEHLVKRNLGDGTFEDVSTASGLSDVQAGFFAFGDVDNDGDQDCFAGLDVQLPGLGHTMLLNDGTGHFEPVAAAGVNGPGVPTIAGNAVFGDFDGDAKLDLYVGLGHTSFSATDVLLMGNGDGTFTLASDRLVGNTAHPTNGTVTCDFDDDGDLDIVVSTYGVSSNLGLNLLWQNDGTGHFQEVAVQKGFASQAGGNSYLKSTGYGVDPEPGKSPGTFVGSNGFGVDCDDIDGDGLMDIFLTTISHPVDSDYSRKWSDPSQILVNLGPDAGHAFENRATDLGLPFNEGDVDGAIVDFDNDGYMDLSISRESKYENSYEALEQKAWFGLMHQRPDGKFESVGASSGINNLDSTYTASILECDTDAACPDGETCLFARCRNACTSDDECVAAHEKCVWLFDTEAGKHQSFCKPLGRMKKAQNHAWADVDGDGDLDLLVGGRDTGGGRPNFLFRNEIGHQNRWIAVRVEGDGQAVNRDAIGARVTLVGKAGRHLVREVRGSRGMHNSMDSRTLHFGLGELVGCDYTLQIRWPDGTTAALEAGTFPERQHLKLGYPDVISVQ